MEVNRIIQGDALHVLKTLPDEMVDCVVTSPPYWGLRDYGVEEQLGLEPTFQEYITKLCGIFDEVKRVLKKTGTIWINMGDTYGGSYQNYGAREGKQRCKNTRSFNRPGNPQILPPSASQPQKCLLQIPSCFSIEMCNRGWILRNTIIWHKPNCMPSSVKDRFTVDFEYIFFFVKSKTYWFERQYDKYTEPLNRWGGDTLKRETSKTQEYFKKQKIGNSSALRAGRPMRPDEQGRNKRCVWKITTKPFKEAHFAVFPEELVETPIKAGCPEFVCKKCGKPCEKIYKRIDKGWNGSKYGERVVDATGGAISGGTEKSTLGSSGGKQTGKMVKIGYADCGCNADFSGGLVLDPFCGSGTTCVVAKRLNRNYLGIELNPDYIKMAEKRIVNTQGNLL